MSSTLDNEKGLFSTVFAEHDWKAPLTPMQKTFCTFTIVSDVHRVAWEGDSCFLRHKPEHITLNTRLNKKAQCSAKQTN